MALLYLHNLGFAACVSSEIPEAPVDGGGWFSDMQLVESKYSVNGSLIGPQGASSWLVVVPWGFNKFLNWFHDRYDIGHNLSIDVLITENGVDVAGEETTTSLRDIINDSFRCVLYVCLCCLVQNLLYVLVHNQRTISVILGLIIFRSILLPWKMPFAQGSK